MRAEAGTRARGDLHGWDASHRSLHVAVIGATGAVGRELLDLLLRAGHPLEKLGGYARSRSRVALGASTVLEVQALDSTTLRADLVFLCTPNGVSRELAPRLVQAGARVIDLSSALRMDPDVPLVIPEINGDLLDASPHLVANPNCTTAIAALPLAVIDRAAGLEEVVLVSYQAASGAGRPGLLRLEEEMRAAAGLGTADEVASPFPAPLVLNVIPGVAEPDASGRTGEERKIEDELRKILRLERLVVEATTARVPVERCHSVAVHARLARDLEPARAIELLARASGIAFTDDPHGPRPRECAGSDPVHVGRVRSGGRGTRSLCLFAVGDQLRKGAALNALQVAARLGTARSPTA